MPLKNEKEFETVRNSLSCYLLANMTEFGKTKILNYKELYMSLLSLVTFIK